MTRWGGCELWLGPPEDIGASRAGLLPEPKVTAPALDPTGFAVLMNLGQEQFFLSDVVLRKGRG